MSVQDGNSKPQTATATATQQQATAATPAPTSHADAPVVTKVRELLARGQREPGPYADLLRDHPAHAADALALLQSALGNTAVGAIVEGAKTKPAGDGAVPPLGKVEVHAQHGLRVRTSPHIDGTENVIGVLPDHTIADATAHAGEWLAIEHAQKPAFVHGHYVAPVPQPGDATTVAPAKTTTTAPTAPDEATPVTKPAQPAQPAHQPHDAAATPAGPAAAQQTPTTTTAPQQAHADSTPVVGFPGTTPQPFGGVGAPPAQANATASPAGTVTLDQLKAAVAAGKRDEALSDYRQLAPNARITLRGDLALCGQLVTILAQADALAVLGELMLDRSKTLYVGAYGHFVDGAFLTAVLHQVKLDTIATVTQGAADLVANPAYLAEYIMSPILDGARVTAADQHALAKTAAGVALLQIVYPNQSPVVCLGKLATKPALLRDAAAGSAAFADWLFTDSAPLEQMITGTVGQGIEWARVMFGNPRQEQILVGWIQKDPAFWGNEFATGLRSPQPTDAAALRARRSVAGAIWSAIASAQSVESLLGVFVALGFRLPEWIEGLADAGRLTEASLALALEGPNIGPAEQGELAMDSAAVALVRKLMPRKRPSEVLTQLIADPKAYFDALATPGAFADWVTSDPAVLLAEARGLPQWFFWVTALQALDKATPVLQLAAAPGLAPDIARALTVANAWSWFFVKLPQLPVTEADAQTLWKLWDDQGAVMTDNALSMMFAAMYTVPMRHAGQEVVFPQGGTIEDHYHAVDPSKLAMQRFFERYRHLPRAHVNAAKQIAVCDYYTRKDTKTNEYLDDKDPVGRTKTPYQITAGAFYSGSDTNTIIMNGTWTLTSINQDDFKGLAGEKAGAVNRSDKNQANPNMTFFENHAVHEVGHAIGARTNPKYKEKIDGNEFAKRYANWGDGNAKSYARMLGFTDAMDGTSYSIRFGGASTKSFKGSEIREFLTGIVEGGLGSQNKSGLGTAAGDAATAFTSLKSVSEVAGTALYKTMESQQPTNLPGAGWQFPLGINGETKKVHMYNGGWQSYDAAVFIDRVSSYSTSAPGELFAEIYTEYYTHGKIPNPNNGHSPKEYLDALNNASPEELGIPVTHK